MARLPPPVPPPVRHVDRATLDDLDDQESLAKTVERKSVRITTARFASVAPCAIDVVSDSSPLSPPSLPAPAAEGSRPWSSLPAALLGHPRAAIAAALWLACVVAGITGVLVGHARPSRAHATVAVQTTSRAPRGAVVVEANEEITELPILAPGKEADSPAPGATATAARPRRSGFGHMGADRVPSGAAARRAVPRRH